VAELMAVAFASEDYIEVDITTEEKELSFEHEVTQVAILSKVDCYVKFESRDRKAIFHPKDLIFIWHIPCRRLYVRAVSESGKFYAWGEII
jgi:hypothetical protein